MKKLTLLLIAVVLITAACSNNNSEQHHDEHSVHTLPNGDIQEVTASVEELPTFLDDKAEQMKLVYQLAAEHADLLDWIPCYCGCGTSAGHMSNRNCFTKEIREDGSVVWDDHGTRCAVCLNIAIQSIQLQKDGLTTKQIREQIDKEYGAEYTNPTPTPMPS